MIGAGINGIMSAWALLDDGHQVDLFEQADPVGATSSASTKLLHGGLRYLEHGNFGLIREGLRARSWWLEHCPEYTGTIEIAVPVYRNSARWRVTLKTGMLLYEILAGRDRLGHHYWVDRAVLAQWDPPLMSEGLRGAYVFQDGQMNDHALGNWALGQIVAKGASLRSRLRVERIDTDGLTVTSQGQEKFDGVVNACGPWAEQLLKRSAIHSQHSLDLVRGSHLLVARQLDRGFLLESPDDGRPCFVLPYQGRTLIGTTEVRQDIDEPVECSEDEFAYLIRLYSAYFAGRLEPTEVVAKFAGVRPLVASAQQRANEVTRESVIEAEGRVITVFGGKWTTSRELGLRVAKVVRAWKGRPTSPG